MFDTELRLDLLTTALEGGSNYWYLLKSEEFTEINRFQGTFVERLFAYILDGGFVSVYDVENPDEKLGDFNLINIEEAERILEEDFEEYYNNIIEDNWDAYDADTWFQLVIMSAIVFG
jgi:hypothetical protein